MIKRGVRHGMNISYFIDVYLSLNGVLLLAQLEVSFGLDTYKGILRRGYFEELSFHVSGCRRTEEGVNRKEQNAGIDV